MNLASLSISDKFILFLATGFGSGFAPKAPGTVGTVVAILPFLLLQQLSELSYLVIVVISAVLGIYLCNKADELLQSHDNKAIVWDEFCGLWITLFMVPQGWQWLLLGFLLFRLFDILKPFPISLLDKHVKGGLGVMVDDLVAGLFAFLILQSIVYFELLAFA